MNYKIAVIPIEVVNCWTCPNLYIYRCLVLEKNVKEAVKDDTIDDECPYLVPKNNQ